MGLAHRIIPTLLCRGRTLVKGQCFEPWRGVGLAVQGVRINQARDVDELVLVDVAATREGRTIDPELVREITDILYAPIAVGGGVRSIENVRALLNAGADKIIIGTRAVNNMRFLRECADTVGSQAIVVAIDATRVKKGHKEEIPDWPGVTATPIALDEKKEAFWTVKSHCGTQLRGGEAHDLARTMEVWGAGEILLTSIEREGTLEGYDLELIRKVSKAVSIPVIAHGGCRGYGDMLDAIHAGASAVAAGALFQFTEATPRGAAQYLHGHGVEVRL